MLFGVRPSASLPIEGHVQGAAQSARGRAGCGDGGPVFHLASGSAQRVLNADDSEAEPLLLYEVGPKLGAGAFGEVKLAVHRATGARVAIKTYEKYKVKQYERVRTGNFDDNRPICSEIGTVASTSTSAACAAAGVAAARVIPYPFQACLPCWTTSTSCSFFKGSTLRNASISSSSSSMAAR